MKSKKIKLLGIALINIFLASLLHGVSVNSATYYVDATEGNDNSPDPTNITTPWQSIAKVNSWIFSPGDNVYFKRSEMWAEMLVPPSSGVQGNPITFGAYGTLEFSKSPPKCELSS